MRRRPGMGEVFTFGGRVPATVGALTAAVVAASLLGAVSRGLVGFAALVPSYVWRGEVWRLVTWVFFETSPISLIFSALMLYWFGRDLCYAWGPQRFLTTFFGIAIATSVATCLLERVWPGVHGYAWTGLTPVVTALIVGWAMLFPERQILFMLALPVSGRALLWLTLGGTLLFAVFQGLFLYAPHLIAQGLMVVYARGYSLRGLWQSLRIRSYERRARRRASHLKVIKKEDPPRWMN